MDKDFKNAIGSSIHLNSMIDIVRAAGDILLLGKKELSSLSTISKTKNPNDILSKYDLLVQRYIYSELQNIFPSYKTIGEEEDLGKSETIGNDFVWIIDPIDGTLNFLMDRSEFSISLALFKHGKPFAGIVYAPARNELYVTEKGKGAFLNENKIYVRNTPLTPFPLYHFELHKINYDKIIGNILPMAAHIRRFGGSAALDLAFVASGKVDAQFSTKLNIWDVAAGVLLVSEAGGICVALDGKEMDFTLKPNGYSYIAGSKEHVDNIVNKIPRIEANQILNSTI